MGTNRTCITYALRILGGCTPRTPPSKSATVDGHCFARNIIIKTSVTIVDCNNYNKYNWNINTHYIHIVYVQLFVSCRVSWKSRITTRREASSSDTAFPTDETWYKQLYIYFVYIYRIKGILFSILSLSGPLSGEPDRVSQMMVLIKTVSKTNSPLFCLSVIYIQKSLQRWEKYFFADTEKISGLNSI
jgi:hypothetical protein